VINSKTKSLIANSVPQQPALQRDPLLIPPDEGGMAITETKVP
jgi:hypothetical protein